MTLIFFFQKGYVHGNSSVYSYKGLFFTKDANEAMNFGSEAEATEYMVNLGVDSSLFMIQETQQSDAVSLKSELINSLPLKR